jgi:hypothetical protein
MMMMMMMMQQFSLLLRTRQRRATLTRESCLTSAYAGIVERGCAGPSSTAVLGPVVQANIQRLMN